MPRRRTSQDPARRPSWLLPNFGDTSLASVCWPTGRGPEAGPCHGECAGRSLLTAQGFAGPRRRTWGVLVALLLLPVPDAASAQPWRIPDEPPPGPTPVSRDLRLLGINSLLGGLTGALGAAIRGEPAGRPFFQGTLGGGLAFAGKRIAVEEWWGAGLAGRQVTSVGSSIVGNAAAGRGTLDRLAFGLGPVRLYAGREVDGLVDWRVDAVGTAFVLRSLVSSSTKLQVGESLSAGAFVFRSRTGSYAVPGMISFADEGWIPHERIHVLQWDQSFLFWGDPVEEWIAGRVGFFERVKRRVEFNFVGWVGLAFVARRWEHRDWPWEKEARNLEGRR